MDDLLQEFIAEATENLAVIDQELVRLEQQPNDTQILGNIFRLVHTVKGTCGFLGLSRLEKVAHSGENVLGKFRDGELEVTPDAVTTILECIDRIREILSAIEETGSEPEGDDTALIQSLDRFLEGGDVAPAADAPKQDDSTKGDDAGTADDDGVVLNEFGAPIAAELLAELEAAGVEMEADSAEPETAGKDEQAPSSLPESSSADDVAIPPAVNESAEEDKGGVPQKAEPAAAQKREPASVTSSLRINVDVLENLMTLVSELVLARNQLLQMVRGYDDHEFAVPLQLLSHITSDLQEGVMQTRMQPIGNAWSKLPRIVRDLSVASGKKIDLVMEGAETELDRQILDLIKDPLTHMVRNSADHGLETPEERQTAGKPEGGTIRLNAFHEGGHIIVEISDDGRGLNTDRIREKIVEKEILSDSAAASLTEQQVQQYIFHPGFSTAEKVTNVSGRGVGMDVVRTNIEQINGSIDLRSTKGEGTTVTIKIPLTLAIISALLVKCATERFAIPQFSVLELVRTAPNSEHQIEYINKNAVLHLRNQLLPLIRLDELLGLADGGKDRETEDAFVVVTKTGNSTFGIVVDQVFDTEEIVVKPTSPVLRGIRQFSGNTILGDGSVIMILDPNGIAAEVGEIEAKLATKAESDKNTSIDDKKVPLLLFKGEGDEPMAVPLVLVARLEDIAHGDVEYSGGYNLVQYRDTLMPLVTMNDSGKLPERDSHPVLVFADRGRQFGLVVNEVVDIVEDKIDIEMPSNRDGTLGSAVINGHAMNVLDSEYFIHKAFGDNHNRRSNVYDANFSGRPKTLLVDDSNFFRSLISPLLSVEGWEVTSVSSAKDALALRDAGEHFELIISDIDMPDIDGFDFASSVRNDDRWGATPLIALSSHSGQQQIQRAHTVGFTDYVAKNDREGLLRSIRSIMSREAA
ncbi:MAG: hybrid sensor histidine kinase/response regulator [Rhodospirillales bacterium]